MGFRCGFASGAALAMALLSGGAVNAAQTGSGKIDDLPQHVAGVVGSGDRLSLRLTSGALDIGEAYDGWTLRRLTPAVAVFAKGGQTRQIGLNPSGVVPPPQLVANAGDPLLAGLRPGVDIAATNPRDRAALVEQLAQEPNSAFNHALEMGFRRTIGQWMDAADKGLARPGLTLDETRRFIRESIDADQALSDMGIKGLSRFNYPGNRIYVLGGEDGDDYRALFDRTNAALAAQQAALAGAD